MCLRGCLTINIQVKKIADIELKKYLKRYPMKPAVLGLILFLFATNGLAAEFQKQTYECTYIPTKDVSERLSVEIRDGMIYRFDYTQIHQPGDTSCSAITRSR